MSASWREGFADLRQKARTPLCRELRPTLEALLRASADANNRESVSYDDLSLLSELLSKANTDEHAEDTVVFAIKLMRNLCAGVPRNQRLFLQNGSPGKVLRLLSNYHSTSSIRDHLLKAALQFLGNMCTNYPEAQAVVWDICFPEFFESVLCSGVWEAVDLCTMVIHLCTLYSVERRMLLLQAVSGSGVAMENGNIVATVLCSLVNTSHSEWILIFLEALIQSTTLSQFYTCLEHQPKAMETLFSFICMRLTSVGLLCTVEWAGCVASKDNTLFIGDRYKCISSDLLSAEGEKLSHLYSDDSLKQDLSRCQEFIVFKSILGLMCHLSSFEECLLLLQSDITIIESTLALLRRLATLDGSIGSGKHRTKLSKVSPTGQEEKHALFAVKTNLVRLIANLCYRCPTVQMKVNETNSITLILNQCNIDHYNPYIMQWSVFAVRNLCEDNPANQNIISGLERQGIADVTKLLEFGCKVVVGDDGKIKRLQTKCDANK